MTLSEIISRVNTLNPNAFDEETKGKLLCAFESRLIHTLKGEDKDLSFPEDLKTPGSIWRT